MSNGEEIAMVVRRGEIRLIASTVSRCDICYHLPSFGQVPRSTKGSVRCRTRPCLQHSLARASESVGKMPLLVWASVPAGDVLRLARRLGDVHWQGAATHHGILLMETSARRKLLPNLSSLHAVKPGDPIETTHQWG